jgi:alpha-tubulin suppressor-like RCC1 family protein
VAAGLSQTCGVSTTGEAYCWGIGPLGGLTTRQLKPFPVAGGLHFAGLSAASGHTCGTTTAALAYCWGGNGWGQLGDGTTTERQLPTAVASPG